MDKKISGERKRPARKSPPAGKSGRVSAAPRSVRKTAAPAPAQPGPIDDLIQKTASLRAGDTEKARLRQERDAIADQKLAESVTAGVGALLDRKAEKLVVLALKDITPMADFFVLASATNERQAQALSDAVEETLKKRFGLRPLSIEGYLGASWILLDYGDIVFHVFREEARKFYSLERLWGDAPDATKLFVKEEPRRPAPAVAS